MQNYASLAGHYPHTFHSRYIISYTSALFLAPLRFNPQAALNRTDPRHDLPNPVIQALQKHESLLVDAVDYRGQPALAPRVTDGMYDSQSSMLRRLKWLFRFVC